MSALLTPDGSKLPGEPPSENSAKSTSPGDETSLRVIEERPKVPVQPRRFQVPIDQEDLFAAVRQHPGEIRHAKAVRPVPPCRSKSEHAAIPVFFRRDFARSERLGWFRGFALAVARGFLAADSFAAHVMHLRRVRLGQTLVGRNAVRLGEGGQCCVNPAGVSRPMSLARALQISFSPNSGGQLLERRDDGSAIADGVLDAAVAVGTGAAPFRDRGRRGSTIHIRVDEQESGDWSDRRSAIAAERQSRRSCRPHRAAPVDDPGHV